METILDGRYELYDYGHALDILQASFSEEWNEILTALEKLWITHTDITEAGGNKTAIAKKVDDLLFPYDWAEAKITGDLVITQHIRSSRSGTHKEQDYVVKNWLEAHNIDFVKGKVALDLEWNSKDQTFDRDLMAMRAFYDAKIIDVGIILTRAESLNNIFRELDTKGKYGASTTHIKKLLYRLDNRRNGACPILAIGITGKNVLSSENTQLSFDGIGE